MSKFNNVITEVDGIKFASKKEAKRYGELKLLAKIFKIKDLRVQPSFPLKVNGFPICAYVADFQYVDAVSGRTIVEDVKSPITRKNPVYRIKVKLLYALTDIAVVEV